MAMDPIQLRLAGAQAASDTTRIESPDAPIEVDTSTAQAVGSGIGGALGTILGTIYAGPAGGAFFGAAGAQTGGGIGRIAGGGDVQGGIEQGFKPSAKVIVAGAKFAAAKALSDKEAQTAADAAPTEN